MSSAPKTTAVLGDEFGMRYFGLIGLQEVTGPLVQGEVAAGRQFVFGLRNAHDMSFSASGLLGTHAFVCDNLAFHSGTEAFRFARKHTKWALRDLPKIVGDKLAGLRAGMAKIEQREEQFAAFNFNEVDAANGVRSGTVFNDLLMRCLRNGAVNAVSVPHIVREFSREDGPGGKAPLAAIPAWTNPTMFRFLQACTEVDKGRPNLLNLGRRHERLLAMCDGTVASYGRKRPVADAAVVAAE